WAFRPQPATRIVPPGGRRATVSSQLRHDQDTGRGVQYFERERTVARLLIATPPTDGDDERVTGPASVCSCWQWRVPRPACCCLTPRPVASPLPGAAFPAPSKTSASAQAVRSSRS